MRHCAFIRGSAIVGKGCVVGNSVELKNVVLFDKVQVPHYNYVGDSVLGYRCLLYTSSRCPSRSRRNKASFNANTKNAPFPGAFFGALGPLMKQNNRCKAGKSRI